ncbi:hypothetical protein ACLQ3K_24860 [Tsukamurella sp. DT100]|uniref:hypothetical protein n=1 Tax=Tsukamurella sp. DT100 TaxID=3393415 RepID=UPI003CF0F966
MRLIPTLNGRGGGNQRRLLAVVTVAAIVIFGLALASWIYTSIGGDDSGSAGQGTEQHEGSEGVDRGDAREVTSSVLTTMFSWTPGTDRSPADAVGRALPQLTGTARANAEATSGPVRPISQWSQWAEQKTLVVATAPTETMTSVPISAGPNTVTLFAPVTQFLQPVSGAATGYAKFTVRVTLEQVSGHWLVSNYTFTTIG